MLIGEYELRFFTQKEFKYPCSLYPIKTRHHILHECKRYNNYWNPRRDTVVHFTLFLEFNSKAFSFRESITELTCSQAFLMISFYFLSLSLYIFFLFFFSSCSICLHICSYKVATTVCPQAPCNRKSLNKKLELEKNKSTIFSFNKESVLEERQ